MWIDALALVALLPTQPPPIRCCFGFLSGGVHGGQLTNQLFFRVSSRTTTGTEVHFHAMGGTTGGGATVLICAAVVLRCSTKTRCSAAKPRGCAAEKAQIAPRTDGFMSYSRRILMRSDWSKKPFCREIISNRSLINRRFCALVPRLQQRFQIETRSSRRRVMTI